MNRMRIGWNSFGWLDRMILWGMREDGDAESQVMFRNDRRFRVFMRLWMLLGFETVLAAPVMVWVAIRMAMEVL